MLQPLRVRDFRLLWGGQMVSLLGDGIFTVALAWQVIHLSGSAAALSVVLLARSLPGLLLVPVSGVAADRFPRRTIMLAADVVRGVAVGIIALLAAAGTLQVWHLVVLSAVFGCGTAFFQPAAYSLYPDIVTPELLLASNSNSAWAVSGLFQLGVGLSGHLWVATVFLAGLGCGLGLGNVIWFTLVQQRVARHMMGRVFSIDTMVSLGLLPLSYAVAGPVVGWIGAGPTMAVGGVISLVLTGAALVVPGALDTDRSSSPA